MNKLNQLRHITSVFIKDTIDYEELNEAIKTYKEILQSLNLIDLDTPENRTDVHATGGVAIAPSWAALCVEDAIRTRQFVRGVHQAIEQVLAEKKDSSPVEILYAGTGPFATLVLCLLPQYTPQQIKLTLLEINDISFRAVESVFEQLGFQNFVRELSQENAVTFQIQHSPDIIISETMLRALDKEPQIAIMMNLLAQAKPDVIMIPQNIRLNLGVSRFNNETLSPEYQNLSKLLETDATSLLAYRQASAFPSIRIKINLDKYRVYQDLGIHTDIQVFEDCHISFNQSGLTIPKKILDIGSTPEKEVGFEFQYQIEPLPELTIKSLI